MASASAINRLLAVQLQQGAVLRILVAKHTVDSLEVGGIMESLQAPAAGNALFMTLYCTNPRCPYGTHGAGTLPVSGDVPLEKRAEALGQNVAMYEAGIPKFFGLCIDCLHDRGSVEPARAANG